jgi:hypothetical protein
VHWQSNANLALPGLSAHCGTRICGRAKQKGLSRGSIHGRPVAALAGWLPDRYPTTGTIVALDPDIPPEGQRCLRFLPIWLRTFLDGWAWGLLPP